MKDIHQALHTRPTYVEINMGLLEHNYQEIKKFVGDTQILCIVKGNGYGHGIVEVSQLYQKLGADYLGVAIPEEGVELRNAGITMPILVLGGLALHQIDLCIEHDLTITAPSDDKLLYTNEVAKKAGKIAKVHLKVDTGMSRIGVNYERIHKFWDAMKQCDHIEFEGLYSHFASADTDPEYTQLQIKRFTEVIKKFQDQGHTFPCTHIANSSGLLNYPNAHFTMVRPGIILYGLHEGFHIPKSVDLQPAMSWKSTVVYFKFLKEGTPISYLRTCTTDRDTRIVTVPLGYADGYQRSLSNKAKVIINDRLADVVGLVCMDQFMVDIGPDGEAYKNDEVILVGKSKNHEITFDDLARWADSSVHELLAQISYRVPRLYTK